MVLKEKKKTIRSIEGIIAVTLLAKSAKRHIRKAGTGFW